jgi:DNA-binding MarR family transcriptional regulator
MATDNTKDAKHEIEVWGSELNARAIMFHHAVGERMGLSATEHKAADILRRFGPMTAGELAAQTGLTTGAVTGLVDRLEKDGFVLREHDKHDRRRVIIKPAARGKFNEVQDLFTPLRKHLSDILATYDEKETAAIADFASRAAEVFRNETQRLRDENRGKHTHDER